MSEHRERQAIPIINENFFKDAIRLTAADLNPEASVALDIFLRDHPDLDVSKHILYRYVESILPLIALECPECLPNETHNSPDCTCIWMERGVWTRCRYG